MCSGWQLSELVRPAGETPTITLASAHHLNTVDPYWSQPLAVLAPVQPFVLVDLPARLLAPGAWIVLQPDTFVFDTAFWNQPDFRLARRWHDIFLRKKTRQLKPLPGRVLSLASDFAPYSYGHWLIDSLPRWLLAQRAGLSADDFDTIYLPCPDTPSTRQLLAALRLPPEKIWRTPPTDDFEVEHLTAISFPGAAGSASHLAREIAIQLQPPRTARRLIYLSRDGHRRNFANHGALLPVFAELGFEICSPAVDSDIISKCSEARIIVGIEGSQCFNALFAPAGSALVVIAPHGFHPAPYMQSIAGASGLSLYLLGARSVGADSSCVLDPDELRRGLRRVLAAHP